uniref:Response regulator transcription factor n=3 Tax=unclassified Prevotella TaxID=2638335 RepID=A0AB33JT23_9BACT
MEKMKQRILVVDDERDLCEIIQFNLENEGFEVDVAYSAEEVLAKESLSGYDLMILDVMMGEMSGFSLAKRLKQDSATSHIPIIFATARDTENDTVTGLTIGADDYIAKPFSVREMILRVKAVLRRTSVAATGSDDAISYQTLRIIPSSKKVELDGVEIPFTKTEFELLSLLLSHRGHVFSRQDLITKIWPSDVLVLDRTVDVNITRIRKKVGIYAKNIVTRQGFGYYFED